MPSPSRIKIVVPAAVAVAGVTAVVVPLSLAAARPTVHLDGVAEHAVVGAAALQHLTLRASVSGGDLGKTTFSVDGKPQQGQREGNALVLRPSSLSDGAHTVVASVGTAHATRHFSVDTTPPGLTLDNPVASGLRSPVSITGHLTGAGTVTAEGQKVDVTNGAFTLHFPTPPAGLKVVASDAAGNSTTKTVDVVVPHPRMQGVHVTAIAWSDKPLRDGIIKLIKQHKINTIELDVKDEDGVIGYSSKVPLAVKSGASSGIYDATKTLATLHKMGIRVVGRVVCFRDPTLAKWALKHGHKDWDVLKPDGTPYTSSYGSIAFTNFASPEVRKYNIDVATEAAKLGFDDILYDYVRRPDGPLAKMRFPGAAGVNPQVSVAAFVRDSAGPVRAAGAYLGASVFAESARRPQDVGQNIVMLGKWVDYLAPMVYPSLWNPGEYGVKDPAHSPYDIVLKSVRDFRRMLKGTNAQTFPWVQDYSIFGVHYGAPELAAQIRAAAKAGDQSFLVWNPACVYDGDALHPLS